MRKACLGVFLVLFVCPMLRAQAVPAEAALITGLRVDRNECVRLAAARALGSCCCCTKKTIAALTITVSGSSKDGNPSENSERVREAAAAALEMCVTCYEEMPPEPVRP